VDCTIHPGQEIKGVCVSCKTHICDLCEFEIQGKSYCKKCATVLMEDIDAKLKLEIPEVVKCEICGKPRYSGQQFNLCSNCGVVTCPEHWYEEKKLCEKCYDQNVEEEIAILKREGLVRPCPNCGTDNKLTAETCRNRECKASLPKLKNAEEIRKRNVPCANHPEKPAYVQCASCGKYLCLDCENTHKKEHYCSDCLKEIKTKEAEIRNKRLKTAAIVTVIVTGVLGVFFTACLIIGTISVYRGNVALYESALEDYESGNYDGAIEKLTALDDFKDSEKKLEEARNAAFEKEVGFAKKAEGKGELEKALSHYEKAGTYGESQKDIARVNALIGANYFESKEFEKAREYYEKADGIDKLAGEDLNNLRYCNAWIKNEDGVAAIGEANEILSSFKYAKAVKDTTEYEKLKTASGKTNEGVKNFEEAQELYVEFPGLTKRLDDSKKKRDSIKGTLAKLEKDRAAEADREARRAAAEAEREARRTAAEAEKEARKLAASIRKEYGKTLEIHYLDQGLDIRVSVYGPENTYIKLTYVLFTRVWAHEFAKGDIMTEMRNLGFKKVTLSDGYSDYWYWNLD
jgi:tetratricopeptide (TPR) repeat protein